MRFHATLLLNGKTATGIQVPDDVMTGLGPQRRAAVSVTIGDFTYRTTVASMGGVFMIPVSAEIRQATGKAAGDKFDVEIALDTAPREVEVPADFASALGAAPEAESFFAQLSFTNKSTYVLWIESAKKDETRQKRILDAVVMLQEGRKQR